MLQKDYLDNLWIKFRDNLSELIQTIKSLLPEQQTVCINQNNAMSLWTSKYGNSLLKFNKSVTKATIGNNSTKITTKSLTDINSFRLSQSYSIILQMFIGINIKIKWSICIHIHM